MLGKVPYAGRSWWLQCRWCLEGPQGTLFAMFTGMVIRVLPCTCFSCWRLIQSDCGDPQLTRTHVALLFNQDHFGADVEVIAQLLTFIQEHIDECPPQFFSAHQTHHGWPPADIEELWGCSTLLLEHDSAGMVSFLFLKSRLPLRSYLCLWMIYHVDDVAVLSTISPPCSVQRMAWCLYTRQCFYRWAWDLSFHGQWCEE